MALSVARVRKRFAQGLSLPFVLGIGLSVGFVLLQTSRASAIFTECPPVGADTGCALLITIPASGPPLFSFDATQPHYDTLDDTLVGVLNNSRAGVPGLALTGPNAFGFDGDGATTFRPPPNDPTGYAGPNTSFSVTDLNNGTVFFTNGLSSGESRWFSLEADPATAVVTPEPGTLALMVPGAAGIFGVLAATRVRRTGRRSDR